jgi:hypothetical protein
MKRTLEECVGGIKKASNVKRSDVVKWCKENDYKLLAGWEFCTCSVVEPVLMEDGGDEIGCKNCCTICNNCEKWFLDPFQEDSDYCEECLDTLFPETCSSCKHRVLELNNNNQCSDCAALHLTDELDSLSSTSSDHVSSSGSQNNPE